MAVMAIAVKRVTVVLDSVLSLPEPVAVVVSVQYV